MPGVDLEKLRKAAEAESPASAAYSTALANRNYGLITRFSSRVRLLLTVLVVVQLLIGGLALKLLADQQSSRRNAIVLSCKESNRRHAEAIPLIANLIRNGTRPKDPAEREAQDEAIAALLPDQKPEPQPRGAPPILPRPSVKGQQPRTAAGRQALRGINLFIQIIAPSYDCAARLARFTKP